MRRQRFLRNFRNKRIMTIIIMTIIIFFVGFFFLKGCRAWVKEINREDVSQKLMSVILPGNSAETIPCFEQRLLAGICPGIQVVDEEMEGEYCQAECETTKTWENETTKQNGATQQSGEAQEKKAEQSTESETDGVPANTEEGIMATASKVYSKEQIYNYDYVKSNMYVIPSDTDLPESILDLEKIMSTDITIEKDSSKPQILIFHTHSQEKFADSDSNGKSIVDVGDRLTELLQDKYGYNVMHIRDSFDVVDGKLDREKAYVLANKMLDKVMKENPSIQVVLDLHRDGVDPGRHLVTDIDGKNTAKIMLFNGISYLKGQGAVKELENPYLTGNMAMTYKMYLVGKALYPDFIRCIYIAGYRYCLHHAARSMLLEAGAQTNTFEEVYNAMEPLALLLDKILRLS